MFGANPNTININQSGPGIGQRLFKFDAIRIDGAMFLKAIGLLILVVFAVWFFRNRLTWLFKKKTYYPDIKLIQGGGDVTAAFLAQVPTHVQMMKAAISNVGFQSYKNDALCQMFSQLNSMKVNELITCINSYNKNSTVDFKSAIGSLSSGCLGGTNYKQQLEMKFIQFKI
jgi:hypothetical protein